MLSVYIRRPAGLDLAEQPFPLMMEVGRRFAAAARRELRAALDPALATQRLPHQPVRPAWPARPDRWPTAATSCEQLAALFLESPRRARGAPDPIGVTRGSLRPFSRPPRLAGAARRRPGHPLDRHRACGQLRTEFNIEASLPAHHPLVEIDRKIRRQFGGRNTVIALIVPRQGDVWRTDVLDVVQRRHPRRAPPRGHHRAERRQPGGARRARGATTPTAGSRSTT